MSERSLRILKPHGPPHPHRGYMTDEEVNVATNRQREIAEKVAALPSTDMATMRLKARVYMC
jgi:hypothetical protein